MRRPKAAAAALILGIAGALALYGQLVPNPKIAQQTREFQAALAAREPDVLPVELIDVMHNNQLQLAILDVRDEAQYNLFHIIDSRRLELDHARWLSTLPPNTIKVLVAATPQDADHAWITLRLAGVQHLYILSGGIDNWLDTVAGDHEGSGHAVVPASFTMALGSNVPAADPPAPHANHEPEYTPKIKPPTPLVKRSGGCGG